MAWIIALVLAIIIAVSVFGFVHLLFTPWLLVLIAIAAWIEYRPGRGHR